MDVGRNKPLVDDSNMTTGTEDSCLQDTNCSKQLESSSSGKTRHDKENQNSHVEEAKNCFECNRSLAETPQLIHIAGQAHRWHPECFRCNICREPMDRKASCHIYKDKILCRADYIRLQRDNLVNCARCKWPVGPSDWIRRAGALVYHLACFNCDICLRQLNTGEQFAINVQERDHVVRLLCRLHFTIENISGLQQTQTLQDTSVHEPASDSNHRQKLLEEPVSNNNDAAGVIGGLSGGKKSSASSLDYVSSLNRNQKAPYHRGGRDSSAYLHQNRFMNPVSSPTSALAAKLMLHPTTNLSGLQAANSLESASAQELTKLCKPLAGEEMSTIISVSASKHHSQHSTIGSHNHIHQQHCTSNSTSSLSSNGSSSSCGQSTSAGAIINNGSGGSSSSSLQSKSKRVRTTFTEDQLSILQNHFHIDSNPDGQDLERIATITGLSKRVTQVWFQNSRARQKKYMIKRKPGSAGTTANLIVSAASISLPSDPAVASNSTRPRIQQQHLSLAETNINSQHILTPNGADDTGTSNQFTRYHDNQALHHARNEGKDMDQSNDNWSSKNSEFDRNDDDEDNDDTGDADHDFDNSSSNDDIMRVEQVIDECEVDRPELEIPNRGQE